jgi:hypothetical protein
MALEIEISTPEGVPAHRANGNSLTLATARETLELPLTTYNFEQYCAQVAAGTPVTEVRSLENNLPSAEVSDGELGISFRYIQPDPSLLHDGHRKGRLISSGQKGKLLMIGGDAEETTVTEQNNYTFPTQEQNLTLAKAA